MKACASVLRDLFLSSCIAAAIAGITACAVSDPESAESSGGSGSGDGDSGEAGDDSGASDGADSGVDGSDGSDGSGDGGGGGDGGIGFGGGVFDLDESAGDWAIYEEGNPEGVIENVTTPSLDGLALRCGITGGDPYSNIHCYTNLEAVPEATDFELGLSFWVDETTCNNEGSPSVVQALEFTMDQWKDEVRYEWALQWQNAGEGAPQWRYWDPHQTDQWVALDPPLEQCLASEAWHDLVLVGAIVDGSVYFSGFSLDGEIQALGLAIAAEDDPGAADKLAIAVQVDGNSAQTPYSVYLDGVRFEWSWIED